MRLPPVIRAALRFGPPCAAISVALAACGAESPLEPPEPAVPTAHVSQAIEADPAWIETGAMSVARYGLTATAISEGRVLVTGGRHQGAVDTGDVFFDSAEIWVPMSGAFTFVSAKMSVRRTAHAAALLPSGKVLVAGGGGDAQSATTAEIFDPKSNTWSGPLGLAHPHVDAAITVLTDGRALLIGGDSGGGAVEIFDPKTGAWSDAAPLMTPRQAPAAALLADGRVLVTGGIDNSNPAMITAKAEIWSPSTLSWAPAAPMAVRRTGHTAVTLANGTVLVAGGATDTAGQTDSVELYDPLKNKWIALPPMTSARSGHTVTLLENGAVLVAGGVDTTGSVLRTSELYDPDANRWIELGLLAHGRLSHAAAALPGGAMLAVGGQDQSTAEVYEPAQNGSSCELGRQCKSGFCIEGVCCNTACSGACVTCVLPGSEGDCSLAASGTDPHHDCGKGGPCDDVCAENGSCTDRVGKVCVQAACVEDGTRAIVEASCVEAGGECATVTVDCAPYRCGDDETSGKQGCRATCASIDDCAEGFACDPEGHCRSRPDVAGIDPQGCSASATAPAPARWIALWACAFAIAAAARRAPKRRALPAAARSKRREG